MDLNCRESASDRVYGQVGACGVCRCGSPDFLLKEIVDYTPRYKDKADDPWEELVRQAIDVEDDGHAAKFVRGLMHGQKVAAKYIVQR